MNQPRPLPLPRPSNPVPCPPPQAFPTSLGGAPPETLSTSDSVSCIGETTRASSSAAVVTNFFIALPLHMAELPQPWTLMATAWGQQTRSALMVNIVGSTRGVRGLGAAMLRTYGRPVARGVGPRP